MAREIRRRRRQRVICGVRLLRRWNPQRQGVPSSAVLRGPSSRLHDRMPPESGRPVGARIAERHRENLEQLAAARTAPLRPENLGKLVVARIAGRFRDTPRSDSGQPRSARIAGIPRVPPAPADSRSPIVRIPAPAAPRREGLAPLPPSRPGQRLAPGLCGRLRVAGCADRPRPLMLAWYRAVRRGIRRAPRGFASPQA
jgi:hypothetical protein